MSFNGYSDKLIAIDDEMVALGRPPPPVVSWLSSGLKGNIVERHAGWLKQLEAWEEANPEKAVRWQELKAQYEAQDELERRAKFDGSDDAWNYVLLEHIGCPRPYVETISRDFKDTGSMLAARDWMRDGLTWSLTLIGGTGCGKSTAAAWLAHQLLMRRFRPVWVDCVRQCEAPMYGVAAEHLRWRCREAPVLVLDDMGGGARELTSDFWHAWLDDVIGSRANANKKTIITTNRDKPQLREWLGARLVDRLNAGVIFDSKEKSLRPKVNEARRAAP